MGLCCPLGMSAGPACAAIRAGIKRFNESAYLDEDDEPIVCSSLSTLGPELGRTRRLTQLLAFAVIDAARAYSPERLARMPLFVGTADPRRPGTPTSIVAPLLDILASEHDLRFARPDAHVSATGHTSGLRALAAARDHLAREPGVPACVVVSGDSLVNASTLAWLDGQARLKRSANSDGVIPGEAAACVIVAREPERGEHRCIKVTGIGFAQEAATLTADEPLRGLGLAAASRGALQEAGLDLADIDLRLSDAAGEGYGLKELALALTRVLRTRRESFPLQLPAESLGDTGAAAGLVAVVLGAAALTRAPNTPRRALVYTSDDRGDRGALVLERHGN